MNQLRTIRKDMGLTQVEAANICGVSRRTYQTYEEQEEYSKFCEKMLAILEECKRNYENRVLSQLFIKIRSSEIFAKYPEVKCAYLYGSYARKQARGDSDVDILVVSDSMGMKFYHMAGELKEALGKEVDLQTHRQIGDNESFLESLLTEGVKIYDSKRRINTSGVFAKANRSY